MEPKDSALVGTTRSSSKSLMRSRIRLAFQKLGGRQLLGVDVRSQADFVKVMEQGVPLRALTELSRQEALSPGEVDRLIIARRTLAHRRAKDQHLSSA